MLISFLLLKQLDLGVVLTSSSSLFSFFFFFFLFDPPAPSEQTIQMKIIHLKLFCSSTCLRHRSWEFDYSIIRTHVTCLQVNGNYCKYYRINVSYCIQKNWYLPLYRKIKSLLYIQLMTGVRGLARRNKDYDIRTHNWRTCWYIVINGTCPCSTHAHLTTCTTATPFLSGYFSAGQGNAH